jgi:hypothetical protein
MGMPKIALNTIADSNSRISMSCWVRGCYVKPPDRNTHHPTGNDPELDPDRPADPPTRAIEKPVMRSGKRDGTDAPRPAPERSANQTRTKQTASANENGTSPATDR